MLYKSTHFIDCEFDGHGGPLMSMGLISDYYPSEAKTPPTTLYLTSNAKATDPWVLENVVPKLDIDFCDGNRWPVPDHFKVQWRNTLRNHADCHIYDLGAYLRKYLKFDEPGKKQITFIADCAIDFGYLILLMQTNVDGGYSPVPDDVSLFFKAPVISERYYRSVHPETKHHALVDAFNLRNAYTRSIMGY